MAVILAVLAACGGGSPSTPSYTLRVIASGDAFLGETCDSQHPGSVAVVMTNEPGPSGAVCVSRAPDGSRPSVTLVEPPTMESNTQSTSITCPRGAQIFDRGGRSFACATTKPDGVTVFSGLDLGRECSKLDPDATADNVGTKAQDWRCVKYLILTPTKR